MKKTILAVVFVLIGAAAIGYAAFFDNANETAVAVNSACRERMDQNVQVQPFAKDELAAFLVADKPIEVPDLSFVDEEGEVRQLSEWRGRTVLVNLWATWCAPCREEMPYLDALRVDKQSDDFDVLALNLDVAGRGDPQAWLLENNINSLDYYGDPGGEIFPILRGENLAVGMPTTFMVDEAGCLIGVLHGPAVWNSEQAYELVDAAVRS